MATKTTAKKGPAFLAGLPPYPGGKRRLLAAIFHLVAEAVPANTWGQLTFADAFMGMGSVAITAKSLGFQSVLANDIAERSAIVGRGLLANSSTKLRGADVLGLWRRDSWCHAGACPEILKRLPARSSAFFAAARAHLDSLPRVDARRDMLTTLIVARLIRSFPMGLPTASDARWAATGDFDRISGNRLPTYVDGPARLTPGSLLRDAERLNAAVLPGEATFTQGDVFDFLEGLDADVLYFDPPYPGTQSYERAFVLLDEYLGAESLSSSTFSTRRPPLDELLDASRHVPHLVLSANNAVLDEDELRRPVVRHRPVQRLLAIPYRHYGPVASSAKNASNRELLVLASLGPT